MLLVRAYVFTPFTVTDQDVFPELRKGDRVLVNRLSCDNFKRGEYVIFGDSIYYIGRIVLIPKDTIVYHGGKYVIPNQCCKICDCEACKSYLVTTGNAKLLVRQHRIVGRVYRIFPFRR